jgi:transposase InsO family protein
MLGHTKPQRPWQKVATDLFELNGKHYLLIVDYYSSFFEINQLSTTTSSKVIEICKQHFSRYGIPEVVVSDNGTQYSSELFKNFAKEYQFDHVTSSPGFAQSNGKAEKTLQIANNFLKKAKKENRYPHLALLDYRNSPISGINASPEQLL